MPQECWQDCNHKNDRITRILVITYATRLSNRKIWLQSCQHSCDISLVNILVRWLLLYYLAKLESNLVSLPIDLCWKTTFDGRPLSMEDNLWSMKTFDGRQPLMEDDPWWETNFNKYYLRWKTTFNGRQPLLEDNLWWKVTFDGRWPLMEGNLCVSTIYFH